MRLFLVLVMLVFLDTGYQKLTCEELVSYHQVFTVTAYCPCERCCGKCSPGKTATGRNAYSMGVAVDRKRIPLGSRLDIPGYGNWVLADDVGGAINGNRLDVRFDNHTEALEWGKKKLRVRVWVSE